MSVKVFDREFAGAIEAARAAGLNIGRIELQLDPRKITIIPDAKRGRPAHQGFFIVYKYRGTPRERAYYYHSKTKKRLHGEPGSPEFIRDFAESEVIA